MFIQKQAKQSALLTTLGIILILIASCGTPTGAQTSENVKYITMPSSFAFQSQDTINGWIFSKPINQEAISNHRWDIWRAMTAFSGQILNGTPLPIWETWYSGTETYLDNPDTQTTSAEVRRVFEIPNQSFHAGSLVGTDGVPDVNVLSFVRFTQEIRDHIQARDNNYFMSQELTTLNDAFTNETSLADRKIIDFANISIMMKPVFWVVSNTEPTVLPYWNGTENSATSNPMIPTPATWKQCVLVDPIGNASNNQDRMCNDTLMPAGSYQVVPVSSDPSESAFYAFQLTQTDIDNLNNFNEIFGGSNVSPPFSGVEAGDYAIFLASHVSTREINNWTWQTFWWSPVPDMQVNSPSGAQGPPSDIARPWNQYASCTAYYMVNPPQQPDGEPLICYNPYLETDLTGLFNADQTVSNLTGVVSNCMSCHRGAVYPAGLYPANGYINVNDPLWFTGNMKADFLWSIPSRAHTGPYQEP